MKSLARKHSIMIVTAIFEMVALLFVYLFWLKDFSLTVLLIPLFIVVDYLVFSIFEFYSYERFKERMVFKILISTAVTVVFYLIVLFQLGKNGVFEIRDEMITLWLSKMMIYLGPNLLISFACLVNYMSNKFKFFLIKTISFYIISLLTIIVGYPSKGIFLADFIFFVLCIVQVISGFILSLFKKE